MITNFDDWQGKSGSFLITYPKKWISNFPTIVPTVISVAPSTLSPSEIPSSNPSFFIQSSNVTSSSIPTNDTSIPSILPSLKPSKFPVTVIPTVVPTFFPTFIPSFLPSLHPTTSKPTVVPTRTPSHRPTRTPTASNHPSQFPTSVPSMSTSSQGKTVIISSGGNYEGNNGNEIILIESTANLLISGNQGNKRYIFSSFLITAAKNITIVINDFDNAKDILDFSSFPSSLIFNYGIDPLTFYFSSSTSSLSSASFSIVIVLSSHSDFDLFPQNMILTTTSVSSSSTTSTIALQFSFTTEIIVAVVVLLGLFIILLSILHWGKVRNLLKKQLMVKPMKTSFVHFDQDIEGAEHQEHESDCISNSVMHSSFFHNESSETQYCSEVEKEEMESFYNEEHSDLFDCNNSMLIDSTSDIDVEGWAKNLDILEVNYTNQDLISHSQESEIVDQQALLPFIYYEESEIDASIIESKS
jgi:hypothetical protein